MLILMSIPVFGFAASAMFLLVGQGLLAFLIFLIMVVWPAWVTLSTNYSITGEYLVARCGPLRYRIAIEDIKNIEAMRTLRPGPALSWDKLKITYGESNKMLFISPADKYTFIYDLGIGGEENYTKIAPDDDYQGPIY